MPGALLVQGDFSEGLAPILRERSYDFIVSTYALHHLDSAEKLRLIREALDLLNPGGELLIGNVAFPTQAAQESCRAAAGEEWDEEEHYFVFDELKAVFPEAEFEPVSFCAGLIRWKKPEADAEAGTNDRLPKAPVRLLPQDAEPLFGRSGTRTGSAGSRSASTPICGGAPTGPSWAAWSSTAARSRTAGTWAW